MSDTPELTLVGDEAPTQNLYSRLVDVSVWYRPAIDGSNIEDRAPYDAALELENKQRAIDSLSDAAQKHLDCLQDVAQYAGLPTGANMHEALPGAVRHMQNKLARFGTTPAAFLVVGAEAKFTVFDSTAAAELVTAGFSVRPLFAG